jgi:hypothetical protein
MKSGGLFDMLFDILQKRGTKSRSNLEQPPRRVNKEQYLSASFASGLEEIQGHTERLTNIDVHFPKLNPKIGISTI